MTYTFTAISRDPNIGAIRECGLTMAQIADLLRAAGYSDGGHFAAIVITPEFR